MFCLQPLGSGCPAVVVRSNHPIICPKESCFDEDEDDDYSGAIRTASPHPEGREAWLTEKLVKLM